MPIGGDTEKPAGVRRVEECLGRTPLFQNYQSFFFDYYPTVVCPDMRDNSLCLWLSLANSLPSRGSKSTDKCKSDKISMCGCLFIPMAYRKKALVNCGQRATTWCYANLSVIWYCEHACRWVLGRSGNWGPVHSHTPTFTVLLAKHIYYHSWVASGNGSWSTQ